MKNNFFVYVALGMLAGVVAYVIANRKPMKTVSDASASTAAGTKNGKGNSVETAVPPVDTAVPAVA